MFELSTPQNKESESSALLNADSVRHGYGGDTRQIFFLPERSSRPLLLRWAATISLMFAFVGLTIFMTASSSKDSLLYDLTILENGSRIQLSVLSGSSPTSSEGLYLRIGTAEEVSSTGVKIGDRPDTIILSDPYAWIHGSTFEVNTVGECFRLKSLRGHWLRLDSDLYDDQIVLRADSIYDDEATLFAAITVQDEEINARDNNKFNSNSNSNRNSNKLLLGNKILQMSRDDEGFTSPSASTSASASASSAMYSGHNNNNNPDKGTAVPPTPTPSPFALKYPPSPPHNIKLKVCRRDYWLHVDEITVDDVASRGTASPQAPPRDKSSKHDTSSQVPPPSEAKKRYKIVAKVCPDNRNWMSWFSLSRLAYGAQHYSGGVNGKDKEKSLTHLHSNSTMFRVNSVQQIRGVNLGGWFIPEVWMCPGFYNGTGLGWGGSLCAMVNYSRPLAEARMKHTLDTWITEKDFEEIAMQGFNSVRLPVGYWNVIDDPYRLFAPADYRVSLKYIDWAFEMAIKYDLTILLDLHGGPGSQNGIDHSGCGYSIERPSWTKPENVQLSLIAIEAMARRYGSHPKLAGIELLNEPSNYYSTANHTVLLNYYENAYKIVRKYSPTAMVVFNELYQELFNVWNDVLREPEYYNVVMDWHLYEWPQAKLNISTHIVDAEAWREVVDDFSQRHPIIVGEWSMSTGPHQAGQPFVDACLDSFSGAWGWYLWTWKVQRGIGFDEWDVQYQHYSVGKNAGTNGDNRQGLDPLADEDGGRDGGRNEGKGGGKGGVKAQ